MCVLVEMIICLLEKGLSIPATRLDLDIKKPLAHTMETSQTSLVAVRGQLLSARSLSVTWVPI